MTKLRFTLPVLALLAGGQGSTLPGQTSLSFDNIFAEASPRRFENAMMSGTDLVPLKPGTGANQTDVAFLIDVSGSVDPAEYLLQLEGFARALENPNLIPHDGTVAVSVIQFASAVRVNIPLTLLSDTATALAVAGQIRILNRTGLGGSTAVGDAIDTAAAEFVLNARPTARQAFCLATDGLPNIGLNIDTAISNAQADGIDELDVIVIGDTTLVPFYESRIFGGGPGVGFVRDFVEFSTLVGDKIGEVVQPTSCSVSLSEPTPGAVVITDSVTVAGGVTFDGAMAVANLACEVNGVAAAVTGDLFSTRVPVNVGSNLLLATCTATDPVGRQSTCKDSVFVERPPQLTNRTEITSPADSTTFASGALLMRTRVTADGGVGQFAFACSTSVNGGPFTLAPGKKREQTLLRQQQIFLDSIVRLDLGTNLVIRECVVTDEVGQRAVSRDSVTVFRIPGAACRVDITSPADGDMLCGDSLLVTATLSMVDSASVLSFEGDVNGFPVVLQGSAIQARIPVVAGGNVLILRVLALTDDGDVVTCSDTVEVFVDRLPPTCTFSFENGVVEGTFFDPHSGMKVIEPVEIHNGILTVQPFRPGAKQVHFRIDLINPNKNVFFSINARDVCNNRMNCDPVFLTLTGGGEVSRHHLTFPPEDRYFQLRNSGLAEVSVELNGRKFRLLADSHKASAELNAYFMPADGTITIDLEPYLTTPENTMSLSLVGSAGTGGQVMISPEAERVDYILELQVVPEQFQLAQNFPNPFNPSTNIEFDVPQSLGTDARVQLLVFNLLGELVRVLVDDELSAGRHLAAWDGRNAAGGQVASGVYLYQLIAGETRETRRMLLVR